MDAVPFSPFIPPQPGGNPVIPQGIGGQPDAGTSPDADFGAIFSSLQPLQGRQDLAAVLFGHTPAIGQLVSMPLGGNMAVITTEGTPPSQDSLMAFARSQGLDETAIAALWQAPIAAVEGLALEAQNIASPLPSLPALPMTMAKLALEAPVAGQPGLRSDAGLDPSFHWPAAGHPQGMPDAATDLAGQATAAMSAAVLPEGQHIALSSLTGMRVPLNSAPGLLETQIVQNPAQAVGDAANPVNLALQRSASAGQVWPAVSGLGLLVTAAASQTPPQETPPPPEMDTMTVLSLRSQLLAQSQRTALRNPAPAGAAADPFAPAGAQASRQDKPTPLLDLEIEVALDAPTGLQALLPESELTPGVGSADARPAALSGSQENRAPQNTASSQPTLSGFQLKAEHYQQLADRMGQALAQRLLEQIDRGEWSMKLRLKPAELGQIDVRLEMRAGGLDAHFQAENPLTKELLQQGSGRLKESLGNSGMTLASVSVNSDAERQSSGNPTPQHEQRRATPQQASAQQQSEPVREVPATPKTSDGWDMLA